MLKYNSITQQMEEVPDKINLFGTNPTPKPWTQQYMFGDTSSANRYNTVTNSFYSTAEGKTVDPKKSWLKNKDTKNLLGTTPDITQTAINFAGGKEADNISGGEQFYSKATDAAFKGAVKTGNPWLIAGAAVLKGTDYLNRYAGSTAKEQGTKDINTGGYYTNINSMAGRKNTLVGTWSGKTKKANNLTKYYDAQNQMAGYATTLDNKQKLAATNSFYDTNVRNQQSLFGGINTGILAAKKGAKIKPSELRNIVKKAKEGIKLNNQTAMNDYTNIIKYGQGGNMNLIPEGALHARKHNLPEEIAEQVTNKGIPVVSFDKGGEVIQHAEIENSEIIFSKKTTDNLEQYFKDYKNATSNEIKDQILIKCGKYLTHEILENTDDRVNLIENT